MTLPIAGQQPVERADATRNRVKILEAAGRMVAAGGLTSLSLDAVAREAGVGVGTVYRRFGDRAGLVSALIDERERQFQEAFISGPPPLGPGAPAADRLRAFMRALADRQDEQLDLVMLGQTGRPGANLATGPHRLRHIHVVMLLTEQIPDADVHYLADALLAPLTPDMLYFHLRELGWPMERIKAGLDQLVDRLS